ncbi:hypothetical protein AAG570_008749 [Ranatra chinensis]|uniref:SHSP domain-containing protein n=1 Tax=Ranatra chinensis TaxID=642074 RepID=A0ABD0Z2H5_9HEMI
MSLLSLLLDEVERNRRPFFGDLYDQNFALGLLHDDVLHPASTLLSVPLRSVPLRSGYVRPWRAMVAGDSGVSNIKYDPKGFKVSLDVQQFKPEELNVKVVDDYLVVEAKHEERSDEHGFVSRQFTRRYKLPKDIDSKALTSKLSSDGVLQLEAPKKTPSHSNTREIPIVHTNKPAVENASTGDQKKRAEKMEEN